MWAPHAGDDPALALLRDTGRALREEVVPTLVPELLAAALAAAAESDQIRCNAVRALGHLGRIAPRRLVAPAAGPGQGPGQDPGQPGQPGSGLPTVADDADRRDGSPDSTSLQVPVVPTTAPVLLPTPLPPLPPCALTRLVLTLLACARSGTVKVRWNACHALGNVLGGEAVAGGAWGHWAVLGLCEVACAGGAGGSSHDAGAEAATTGAGAATAEAGAATTEAGAATTGAGAATAGAASGVGTTGAISGAAGGPARNLKVRISAARALAQPAAALLRRHAAAVRRALALALEQARAETGFAEMRHREILARAVERALAAVCDAEKLQ
jgi:hypothetical protein